MVIRRILHCIFCHSSLLLSCHLTTFPTKFDFSLQRNQLQDVDTALEKTTAWDESKARPQNTNRCKLFKNLSPRNTSWVSFEYSRRVKCVWPLFSHFMYSPFSRRISWPLFAKMTSSIKPEKDQSNQLDNKSTVNQTNGVWVYSFLVSHSHPRIYRVGQKSGATDSWR